MNPEGNIETDDSTDRVAEVTETWETSPLTEPEAATDSRASSPADPGTLDDSKTDLQREEDRGRRTDH